MVKRAVILLVCACVLVVPSDARLHKRRYPKHGYRRGRKHKGLPKWAVDVIDKGIISEKQKWEMFGDDGSLQRPFVEDCATLKLTAARVRSYPPTIKHVPIKKAKKGSPRILCWVSLKPHNSPY